MPLVTGKTTLSGATISTSDATLGNAMVTSLTVLAPAGAITWGKSDVATGGAVSLAGAAVQTYVFGLPGIALKEIYFKGTDAQVVNWAASTT